MGIFDDAAQRQIDQESQAARQAEADAEAAKKRATRAADELRQLLIELADYLGKNTTPRSVELWSTKSGMFSKIPLSPVGFPLVEEWRYITHAMQKHGREVVVLLPDGSLWYHSRRNQDFGKPSIEEGVVDLHGKFARGGSYSLGASMFYADRATGALIAGGSSNPADALITLARKHLQ
jgi:hypothetical protein